MKTLLASLVLVLAPALASAACWERTAAMSCAEGTVYDADTHSCVPVTG